MTVASINVPARRMPPAAPVWFGGSMPIARLAVIVNLMVPGLILFWDALHQQLGVNSVNFAIKTTGLVAVTYLVLSLAVTPLRKLLGLCGARRGEVPTLGAIHPCSTSVLQVTDPSETSVSGNSRNYGRRSQIVRVGKLTDHPQRPVVHDT